MKLVIGQSGIIYRADTLEEITHIDHAKALIERFIERMKEFTESVVVVFRNIIDTILDAFRGMQGVAADVLHYAELHEKRFKNEHIRATWHIPKDTRIASQVHLNKPRYQVRKIIR
ncbi:hypothetical protein [Jeotgalibacillus proteolyticus]|uniref:Uncharacterized protein n=1 Tax=Jeotgalibacillus proteolyticus TaxID=2082395 RepID=A0A2S5GAW1_9BACL|nr:hypothetical protein [Jeotgalibacillus proteolyticus]PPA70061.1 hypothetical protein C4B60_10740 [Jeotgalibacillus proteolyticus]